MKVGSRVKVAEAHQDYEEILNAGKQGTVKEITEAAIMVAFDGAKDPVSYPKELLTEVPAEEPKQPATEADTKQLGKGGKDGLPDSSKPKPPDLDTDKIDDLSGEQDQVAQADSKEKQAKPGSENNDLDSETVEVNGEQDQVEQPAGGKERTGGKALPDMDKEEISVNGEQPQMDGVPKRETAKGVKERLFSPITVSVLEQSDGDDEYVTIAEASALRSEGHLLSAVRSAVRRAMEGLERPFDRVDVVFRRNPVTESYRRIAERKVMAVLQLLAEGKAKVADVRKIVESAAKMGVRTARMESYTDDKFAKHLLREAEKLVNEDVKMVWPPDLLEKHIGASVIIETIHNDRLVGKLERAGDKLFQIKTQSGAHKFGKNEVKRILVKPGVK